MDDIFKKKAIEKLVGDPVTLLLLLGVAFGLGLIIAYTYKKTHKGFSYSQNFFTTIVLLTVITTFIVIFIGDNMARAIGIFGAFSIIRFRTAVKDTRDTIFLFFSLGVGLAIGSSSVALGIVGTLIISLIIFLLYFANPGGTSKTHFVLTFQVDTEKYSTELFESVFQQYLKNKTLLNVQGGYKGKKLTLSFNITLKNIERIDDLVRDMEQIKGISDIHFVNSKNDLEF